MPWLTVYQPGRRRRDIRSAAAQGERMYRVRIYRRLWLLGPAMGLLFISNCMAALERNVDILLSPEAAGNIAVAPYSAVAPLLEFLAQVARG
jgi:hypothetical protein